LHEEEILRRNQYQKDADSHREIVEVLEEQIEIQKGTTQELEPVFATNEHLAV